jgi:hypothetical protein
MMLVEPKGTLNTGRAGGLLTNTEVECIMYIGAQQCAAQCTGSSFASARR